MKLAYFVRHAKSSWDHPYLSDEKRPLNSRGKRDAPYMASMMLLKESRPQILLTSPATRAKKTANYFRKAFDLKKVDLIIDTRMYLASPEAMIDVVRALPEEFDTVYLFGHNPGMTEIANFFSDDFVDNVPTCGVIKVSCEIDSWYQMNRDNSRRTAFYYPKIFNLL